MYAMLEGDAPFRGKKALDVAMMHINKPFPQLNEKVPSALREIIMKCVEKRSAERYQNVNELASALEAFLDPIECRRREPGDAWTVRRSTPPGAQPIHAAEIPDMVASSRVPENAIPATNQVKGASRTKSTGLTPSAQLAVRRVKSTQLAQERVHRKPLNSQCVRLKTSPTLQSHSRLNKAQEANKKDGFLKRCLDRIL
jgi:serine/threonine protein kinase